MKEVKHAGRWLHFQCPEKVLRAERIEDVLPMLREAEASGLFTAPENMLLRCRDVNGIRKLISREGERVWSYSRERQGRGADNSLMHVPGHGLQRFLA